MLANRMMDGVWFGSIVLVVVALWMWGKAT